MRYINHNRIIIIRNVVLFEGCARETPVTVPLSISSKRFQFNSYNRMFGFGYFKSNVNILNVY